MTFEIYVEDWNWNNNGQCPSTCSSCWPVCAFGGWGPNVICTIAFASYQYNTSNPNDGVILGLSEPVPTMQATIGLIHQANAKIKMAYGGANSAYQPWAVAGWQDSSVLYAIAQNIASACVGYGFDGVDLDFEAGPPPGSGVAYATLIKNLRQLLPNKIITLTVPTTQILGGLPTYPQGAPQIPANRIWANFSEFHAVIDNLLIADGKGGYALGYVDHINFMEYCMGIDPGNDLQTQVTKDMISFHTGIYQMPYSKMAIGLNQLQCVDTPPLYPYLATPLANWANDNGFAGVFYWDLTQDTLFNAPSSCSGVGNFHICNAIVPICTSPPNPPPKVQGAFQSNSIHTGNNNPPATFSYTERAQTAGPP